VIIEIMDRLLAALRAGDLDAFFTLYEDDALWMSPNSNMDLTKETV
jgi:ketosteroid isomerase-like protein